MPAAAIPCCRNQRYNRDCVGLFLSPLRPIRSRWERGTGVPGSGCVRQRPSPQRRAEQDPPAVSTCNNNRCKNEKHTRSIEHRLALSRCQHPFPDVYNDNTCLLLQLAFILRRLRRVTTSQAQSELERRDPATSGVVSEQALGKALARLGADLAGADLGRLMHRFDAHEVRELRSSTKIAKNEPSKFGPREVEGDTRGCCYSKCLKHPRERKQEHPRCTHSDSIVSRTCICRDRMTLKIYIITHPRRQFRCSERRLANGEGYCRHTVDKIYRYQVHMLKHSPSRRRAKCTHSTCPPAGLRVVTHARPACFHLSV